MIDAESNARVSATVRADDDVDAHMCIKHIYMCTTLIKHVTNMLSEHNDGDDGEVMMNDDKR